VQPRERLAIVVVEQDRAVRLAVANDDPPLIQVPGGDRLDNAIANGRPKSWQTLTFQT
jgi:hypothetical protein